MASRTKWLLWPERLWLRIPFWILVLVVGWNAVGLSLDLIWPYQPVPVAEVPFLEHAASQTSGKVRVTASVLGASESLRVFGVPLALKGIQPVWIEIENGEDVAMWYLRAGTDNEWYSPYEAYYVNRFRVPRQANQRMLERFYELQFQNPVMPGQTRSGFVFTRLDEGSKSVDIDIVGTGLLRSFSFLLRVPGFAGALREDILRPSGDPGSVREIESEAELVEALQALPCCVTNKDGSKQGDPLNLVLVGGIEDIFPAFARRGWHGTEQTHGGSVLKTIRSAILGRVYLYSPVSPLYLFGRSQDLSGQKARGDIRLRNHLRMWEAPFRFRGKRVWIGQISRDIGVRFVWSFPPTTHKIDPDTDEARNGLLQDLAYSQALSKYAFVKGVGAAPRADPRQNLTGDPYFTDGLRVVMFFDSRPTTLDRIELLDWERPSRVLPGATP